MIETLMRVISEKEDLICHLQRHDPYPSRQQQDQAYDDDDDERTSIAARNDLPISDCRRFSHPATSAAGHYA